MLIRKIAISALILSLATTIQLFAQATTKNNKKNSHTAAAKSAKSITILLPDFYHYDKVKKGDTTWVYECFDKDMHKIEMYNLNNMSEIEHIDYYKCFFEYPWKQGSVMSPPYLYVKLYTFEHTGPDSWLGVHPKTTETIQYKTYKNKIVRTENVDQIDPLTKKERKVTFKYLKTEKISSL